VDFAPLNIAFFHPELGIGGAERLVVDAAMHLQAAGHRVTLFTTHHDQARSFADTRDGILAVRVHGDFLPRHIGQRLRAPCMIARLVPLASAMAWYGGRFDIIFCDLVSHIIPVLRLFSRARIVFYCHFPDLLLTPPRHFLYRLYRAPIDRLEELTTGMADRVLVNSRFTASVFRQIFPHLHRLTPEVLYPGIDCEHYISIATSPDGEEENPLTLLSISRYTPKKNLGLAIEALALMRERLSASLFSCVRLIIAGGYDDRLAENRETLRELQCRARQVGLADQVIFKRSYSDDERLTLLSRCLCVVYTPKDEHFGLVPLEAMAAGRPVVAVNSGGPLETIRHEETGLLCEPTPQAFAEALARLLMNREEAKRMGQAGRRHVVQHFSRAVFGSRLETILREVTRQPRREKSHQRDRNDEGEG
jgi:alpha-1,3/alpha-1,6-mannosyltransferase